MKYLKTFELIEAVVRAGSIRKVAEDTNLTASALNRRIQKFDQAFDGLIFKLISEVAPWFFYASTWQRGDGAAGPKPATCLRTGGDDARTFWRVTWLRVFYFFML